MAKASRRPDRLSRERRYAPRGRHSRDDLIDRALQIVARDGLPALTMTRLADEAALSTPALYRYFPGGREELLLEVVRLGAHQISGYVWADTGAADPEEQLRAEAERKLALMRAFGPTMMRSVYAGILQSDNDVLARELDVSWKAADEFIRELVADGMRRKMLRQDLDVEATVQLWLAIGVGIDIVYALGRSPIPIESVYEAFREAMLRQLGATVTDPRGD